MAFVVPWPGGQDLCWVPAARPTDAPTTTKIHTKRRPKTPRKGHKVPPHPAVPGHEGKGTPAFPAGSTCREAPPAQPCPQAPRDFQGGWGALPARQPAGRGLW